MSNPIRGMTRVLTPVVKADLNASIHNRFDVEVIDAKTGEIKQRAQAENVICANLWTRLLTPNSYFNYIHYGTGSGTPASTDTSLFTFLGYGTPALSDDAITNTPASGVYALRRKIQLSETTAVGSTITEVGIGYGTTASTLCTHAMLKDMNGNQISIAKTNTDIINIYATVFVHYAATGYDGGSIKIYARAGASDSATNYKFTNNNDGAQYYGLMPYLCGMYYQGSCCPPTSAFVSTLSAASNYSENTASVNLSATCDISAKKITASMTRLAVGTANFNGINTIAILCGTPAILLVPGGAWYQGANVVGEAIGTGDGNTTDFATDFPYESGGTVYIDGVAQSSGISFSKEPIQYSNMENYLQCIDNDSTAGNIIPRAGLNALKTQTYFTGTMVFYNPYYEAGIASFTASASVSVSNDMINWTSVSSGNVPETYQHYKFWKITSSSQYDTCKNMICASANSGKSIHFATAPASGAVITADYHTPVIAKDANHVFDLTVTIQLGEYTS